jgi:hypothetical protein
VIASTLPSFVERTFVPNIDRGSDVNCYLLNTVDIRIFHYISIFLY